MRIKHKNTYIRVYIHAIIIHLLQNPKKLLHIMAFQAAFMLYTYFMYISVFSLVISYSPNSPKPYQQTAFGVVLRVNLALIKNTLFGGCWQPPRGPPCEYLVHQGN